MKNNRLFYNILMIYKIICSGLIIFWCIRIANLGILFLIFSTLVIISQFFEIFVFGYFFYEKVKEKSLIMILMNIVVYMQVFFLVSDLSICIFGKNHISIFTQLLKVLYVLYLFYCRSIRIKEINSNNID